jgi:dipeptidyl aminopeptidase/acylaminoacyl peptidase
VAYVWDDTGRNELYVWDREADSHERVSDGELPRSAAMPMLWTPDGERVLYHRDEDGAEQYDLCAAGRDGGHETLVDLDGQNQWVAATDEAFLFAGTASGQLNLHRYDPQTGDTEQLTDRERPVYGATPEPGGSRLAVTASHPDDLDGYEAYVADVDGDRVQDIDIGEPASETTVGDWHPDGDRLLVGDDASGMGRVGVYDLGDDSVLWLSDGEHPESTVQFSPDGDRALAVRERDASVVPVVYDLDSGAGRELDLPLGVTWPIGLASRADPFLDDTTVVLKHQTEADRPSAIAYDLASDETATIRGADYGDLDPGTFVEASYHTYESPDGTEIGGLLYEPDVDGDAPGVVQVHGGPHFQSMRRFNDTVQFLATQGYAVFRPNYRGSTGRGREFKLAIRGDWGGKEQEDIAEAGRWLAARDGVDADRVAITGASYGGYSAYCQLVHYPEVWDGVVARVGITDLHALYEEDMPHFKTSLRQQMGDPEENRDRWRERSPVEHVDGADAPLCVIHGVNDPRCPISQARLFRDALVEERGWTEGDEFQYHELRDEGHGSGDIEQKVRTFQLLGAFFDETL